MKLCRVAFPVLWAALFLVCAATSASAGTNRVVDVIKLSGDIDSIHASFLARGLAQAKADNSPAVVVELDTPGGDLGSMEAMVEDLDNSSVPTIVYVYPKGAWAGSAGTFVTMAADLAVMTPGSSIGAASPVGSNGEDLGKTEDRKVMHFGIAYIEAQAREHGHNATFAGEAVHTAKAIPYYTAVAEHVVNFVAPNLKALLLHANGMTAPTPNGAVTFHTDHTSIRYIGMDFTEQTEEILSDPNLLLILMSVGTLALIFELSSPGAILPGIVGVICIVIALYSLQTLTVDLTGLVLMVFGILLFIADIKMPTHGFLTAGGIISFSLGSILLFSPSGSNGPGLSPWTVVLVTALMASFFGFIVRKAIQARRWSVKTGAQGMVGEVATVRQRLDPDGVVFLEGSLWKATCQEPPIEVGAEVIVTGLEGLTVHVLPHTFAAEGRGTFTLNPSTATAKP